MLDLNVNQKKSLSFELQVTCVDYKNITGSMVLEIDGVEYGFPVVVEQDSVSVEIPPLKNIIKREVNHGEKITSKLALNGEGFYLNPWVGEFEVKSPVQAEAKIIEKAPIVKAHILGEVKKKEIKKEQKDNKEYDEIEDQIDDLEIKMIGQPLTKERKANNSLITKTESTLKQNRSFEDLRDDILNRKEHPKPIIDEDNEHPNPKNLKDITDRHVYKVMEMMGTTNKKVQESIYEACSKKAGSDEPNKIFKEVVRFYRKEGVKK
jgi:hypothetical protein